MISIHQPQFLPWTPYFYKVLKSDVFIVLDDVQFQKNGVQNRNMIKTPQGSCWITVPVSYSFGDPINKVNVSDLKIYSKLLKKISLNYSRSKFYNEVYFPIKDIFDKKLLGLCDLNTEFLNSAIFLLGKKKKILSSSSFKLKKTKDERIIEIIKKIGEKEYLSGKGALNYMDLNKYKREGIKVYIYNFRFDEYPQLWNKRVGFLPNLSIIDLLFNNLDQSANYIKKNGSLERVI